MPNWQAPSTNNERHPDDIATKRQATARPYLDAGDGRVHWWTGGDALPVGATPLYVVVRASDARRVLSTDPAGGRAPLVFSNRIYYR